MWGISDEMFKDIERMFAMMKEGGLLEDLRNMLSLGPGPRVEVIDGKTQVRVAVEAPGFLQNRQRWAYRMVGGQLMLRGRQDVEQSLRDDRGRFYSERRSEQFARVVPLPAPVEEQPVKIEYNDGMLILLFKKAAAAAPYSEWRDIPLANDPVSRGRNRPI